MKRLGPLFVIAMVMGISACQMDIAAEIAAESEAPSLPQPTSTYLEMGRVFLREGQVDLAHDAFIRSLRTEGVTASALAGAGVAAERQGLLNDARRHFERAVKIAPSSVVAYNNLGAVLYRLQEFPAAKQAFQTAFALSSGRNAVAERNLGLARMALARDEIENAGLVPNPVPLQRLGTGVYILGATDKAGQDG